MPWGSVARPPSGVPPTGTSVKTEMGLGASLGMTLIASIQVPPSHLLGIYRLYIGMTLNSSIQVPPSHLLGSPTDAIG